MASEKYRTPGNRCYAVFICIFASMGGLYFGYDQGVTGGILTMESFINDFCLIEKDGVEVACVKDDVKNGNTEQFTNFITLYNVLYNIGCIFGGLIGGQFAERFGRRSAVFFAAVSFNLGTYWVISSKSQANTFCLVGRVIEGLGVGGASYSAPLYAAEAAPKEFRGALAGFAQMAIVTGLLAANAVNIGVESHPSGWRITNAVITVPPIIMMFGIWFLPESPRWVLQKKDAEKARVVLQRVRRTDDINEELDAIVEQVEAEVGKGVAGYKDCFARDVRKRTFIAIFLQILQQATGINPIFTYGGLIFSQVTANQYLNLFTLAAVNFFSTIPSLYWVDTFGRRSLLLLGAVGMCLGHLVAGTLFLVGCTGSENEEIHCLDLAGPGMVAFAAIFIFFFAISWGPVGWIYPSEIFPLHVRAKAVSLSTAANWSMGSLMLAVVKLFPLLGIAGVFFLFAALCVLCYIFVYFNCPETKGVLLEDIEYLFSGGEIPEKKLKADPALAAAAEEIVAKDEAVVEAAEEVKQSV